MKKQTAIITAWLLSVSVYAQLNYDWAFRIGSSSVEEARAVRVDAAGNAYTTGFVSGTADFDPGAGTANLTSAGSRDIFLAKYDVNGNYVWAHRFGSTTLDQGTNLFVDNNFVYITGFFTGTVDFDPSAATANLVSSGATQDIFIAKYDLNGNYTWAIKISSPSTFDVGYGIAADAAGNVYAGGAFGLTADFDPGAGTAFLTAGGITDAFIAKYDAGGNYIWSGKMGGSSSETVNGLTLDASANVYVTGGFSSAPADFDPSAGAANLISAGATDIFIAKYTTAGAYAWADRIGGAGDDFGYDIRIDQAGEVNVTGIYRGNVDFDPGAGSAVLSNAGLADVYIGKYASSTGNYIWAKGIGGTSMEVVMRMDLDNSDNIYITGNFSASCDFDPSASVASQTAIGLFDIFIAKYDPSGNYSWAENIGGASSEQGMGIDVEPAGIYISGQFTATVDFDPNIPTANVSSVSASQDAFVAKYLEGNSITTNALPDLTLCPGDIICVPFTAYGSYLPGNTFTVELSDASGSFASPVILGSGLTSPICVTIPIGTAPGTGYRIRVTSSLPPVTGTDNGANITIFSTPAPAISVSSGGGPYCENDPNIFVTATPFLDWGGAFGTFSSPTGSPFANGFFNFFIFDPTGQAGTHTYNFTYTNSGGCSATTSVTFTVDAEPVITTSPLPQLCETDPVISLLSYFSASTGTGTFSGPGVTLTDFDPAIAGAGTHTITYTVVNGACTSTASLTITVIPASWQQTSSATSGADAGRDVTTDASGNIYVTGDYLGSTTFGTAPNTVTISGSGMYVAKYDPCGALIWIAHTLNGRANGRGIIVDNSTGLVYVTGELSSAGAENFVNGIAPPGSAPVTAGTIPAIRTTYIAKYDIITGALVVARGYGNSVSNIIKMQAIDVEGNALFVTGYQRTSTTNTWAAVGKYSKTGIMPQIWGKVQTGTTGFFRTGTDIDVSGTRIYITGTFERDINFGSGLMVTTASSDAFVHRFNDPGFSPPAADAWRAQAGASTGNLARGTSITVDQPGDVYATGSFTTTIPSAFGGPVLPGVFGSSAYITRLDPATGIALWNSSVRSKEVLGTGISSDATDVYITGYFWGDQVFFPGMGGIVTGVNPANPSLYNYYVGRIKKASGGAVWGNVSMGNNLHRSNGVRVHGGWVYTTGHYQGNMFLPPSFTPPAGMLTQTGAGPNAFLNRTNGTAGSFMMPEYPEQPVVQPVEFGQDMFLMNLYPNPNNGQFTVELLQELNTEDLVLEVYDMVGKKVFAKSVTASQQKWQIDLSQYEKGIYLLKASSAGQEVMTKIVIQ